MHVVVRFIPSSGWLHVNVLTDAAAIIQGLLVIVDSILLDDIRRRIRTIIACMP